jgi:uncharacterized membrane protein
MPTYTCPECQAKVKSAEEARPGQEFACPKCDAEFTPRAAPLSFQNDDQPKQKKRKPQAQAAQPVQPVAEPAPKPYEDPDNDTVAYEMAKESEEEERLARKNKPVIGAIRDRFKKSTRGPASALLVTPSNLLLAQGGLLAIFGLSAIIYGLWPLIFTDVPASDEEVADQMFWVFVGIISMVWGSITCYGAVQMVSLGSYGWSMVGAVFGLLPLLAGIFALTTLRDPRVLLGFAEPETGPIQTDADEPADEDDEEEEEEEEEEDDEEEEEERPRKKRR